MRCQRRAWCARRESRHEKRRFSIMVAECANTQSWTRTHRDVFTLKRAHAHAWTNTLTLKNAVNTCIIRGNGTAVVRASPANWTDKMSSHVECRAHTWCRSSALFVLECQAPKGFTAGTLFVSCEMLSWMVHASDLGCHCEAHCSCTQVSQIPPA